MPNAIKWRSKIILAKIEATYGTDSVPTGNANAVLMTDVALQPMEGEDVSRNLERPYFGGQDELPVGLHAILTGSTELVGSGVVGTVPKWGPLARACAMAEVIVADTSVAYNPITDGQESVSIYMWIGGTRYLMKGVRGDATIQIGAQGIPKIRWVLTGLFTQPSEQARPTPDLSAWQAPVVATNANTPTFTIGGVAFVMRSAELAIGNDVQKRFLVGREEVLIVDRAALFSTTVEAVPLTTFDPFARAIAQTSTAVSVVHGVTAGFKSTIAIPTGKVRRLTGLENQQNVLEWPLRIGANPSAGNDDFSITLT